MIRMPFCARDSIYHTAYKLERKLPDALHSTLSSTNWSTLLIALDCTLPACLTVRSQLLSMARSQPAWLTLSSKLSRCSQEHSRECSQVHSQLHSMTLPACLTIRSKVCSQDAPKYTPSMLPSTLCVRSQVHLRVRSQVHSWACSPGRSQLLSMAYSHLAWLYAPK